MYEPRILQVTLGQDMDVCSTSEQLLLVIGALNKKHMHIFGTIIKHETDFEEKKSSKRYNQGTKSYNIL